MNFIASVILLRAQSGPEAMIVGALSWILMMGIIAAFKGAKKAVKGKQFDEVKDASAEEKQTQQ